MKIGLIGAGKMGLSIALKLSRNYEVIIFDKDTSKINEAEEQNFNTYFNINDFFDCLGQPKIVWIMIGHGTIVDKLLIDITPYMEPGDIIVDGGNANYLDTINRMKNFENKNIGFLGAGISGGVTQVNKKLAICVDGPKWAYDIIADVFNLISYNHTYLDKPGKGHLAKIIHNAIEYGMMQSIAEGVALYNYYMFDKKEINNVFSTWSEGSIIQSRLIKLLVGILNQNEISENYKPVRSETIDNIECIISQNNFTPVITQAVKMRKKENEQDPIALSILALLRNEFGGHGVEKSVKNNAED